MVRSSFLTLRENGCAKAHDVVIKDHGLPQPDTGRRCRSLCTARVSLVAGTVQILLPATWKKEVHAGEGIVQWKTMAWNQDQRP